MSPARGEEPVHGVGRVRGLGDLGPVHQEGHPGHGVTLRRVRRDLERLQLLAQLVEARPQSATYRLELADQQLAQGQEAEALGTLDAAIADEPTAMMELRRVRAALGGQDELTPFRQDGLAILQEYRDSDVDYDEPSVLVFDYTAVRVFEDGSSLVLTHQILQANSEESVDELGQFEPPDSGYVLKLRTIKADGAILEPDLLGNMSTINLSNVAVGDFVEQEYVRVLGPPTGIPGGILGEIRFFDYEKTYSLNYGVDVLGTEGQLTLRASKAAEHSLWHLSRPMEGAPSDFGDWQAIDLGTNAKEESIATMYRELMAAAENDSDPPGSGIEGRAAFEMILGIYQSHRQGGCRIDLPMADRRHPLEAWRSER